MHLSRLSNLLWAVGGQWTAQVTMLATTFLLATKIDPKDFGAVAVGLFGVLLCRRILIDGVTNVLVGYEHLTKDICGSGNLAALVISAAAFVAINVVRILFLGSLGSATDIATAALSFVVFIDGLGAVPNAQLQRLKMFDDMAKRAVMSNVFASALAVIAAFVGFGIWSLIVQQVFSSLVVSVFSLLRAKETFTFRTRIPTIFEYFSIFKRVVLNSLSIMFVSRVDVIVISMFYGEESAGKYTFAKRILETASSALSNALAGLSLSYARVETSPGRETIASQTFQFATLISFPAALGLAWISKDIVQALLGQQWFDVSGYIRILALSLPAAVGVSIATAYLLGSGRYEEVRRVSIVSSATFTFGLLFAQVSIFAIPTSYVLSTYVSLIFLAWRLTTIDKKFAEQNRWSFALSIIGSVTMISVISIAQPHLEFLSPMKQMLMEASLGVVIYTLTVCMIGWTRIRALLNGLSSG